VKVAPLGKLMSLGHVALLENTVGINELTPIDLLSNGPSFAIVSAVPQANELGLSLQNLS